MGGSDILRAQRFLQIMVALYQSLGSTGSDSRARTLNTAW